MASPSNQIHSDFVGLKQQLEEKPEKKMHNGNKHKPPFEFTHMDSDFYVFPQDMNVEEISEQGGARTTFSLFGLDKNPPTKLAVVACKHRYEWPISVY
jgi:hypothetical protein